MICLLAGIMTKTEKNNVWTTIAAEFNITGTFL